MVLGTVVFYSALLLLFNLIVDVLYAYLDPRVQVR
jgi:ABC-type dipeptide/oligopeptide/nickel transport system permease component